MAALTAVDGGLTTLADLSGLDTVTTVGGHVAANGNGTFQGLRSLPLHRSDNHMDVHPTGALHRAMAESWSRDARSPPPGPHH